MIENRHKGRSLPHITASCIIEEDGRFLVVEEIAEGKLVINQPSGHVESQESPLQATIRETLEETGWHYQPTSIVGIYYYYSPAADLTYQRICFTGEAGYFDPEHELDSGIRQVLWLTREELLEEKDKLRSPLVMRCIDDYLAGQRYDLNLITEIER